MPLMMIWRKAPVAPILALLGMAVHHLVLRQTQSIKSWTPPKIPPISSSFGIFFCVFWEISVARGLSGLH